MLNCNPSSISELRHVNMVVCEQVSVLLCKFEWRENPDIISFVSMEAVFFAFPPHFWAKRAIPRKNGEKIVLFFNYTAWTLPKFK